MQVNPRIQAARVPTNCGTRVRHSAGAPRPRSTKSSYRHWHRPVLHRLLEPAEYTAGNFQAACGRVGVTQSMGRVGSALDNAVIESWFSTVKSEEGERFESYAHAKEALFD